MELRHLRYFVAVAEEGSVKGAAGRLHIAQPALSRQIMSLEEDLDCEVFERLPRGVRLTAAGEAFLREAREILARAEAARGRAQKVARGQSGFLRVGYAENAAWGGVMPRLLRHYRTKFPDVTIELMPLLAAELVHQLEAHRVGAGFAYLLGPRPGGIRSLLVQRDDVVLAVPRSRGWRGRTDLRLRDLATEPLVLFRRKTSPDYHDRILAATQRAGLSPNIVQETRDEQTMLSLVSAGVGIGFANSANRMRPPKLVDFVSARDLKVELPLQLAWRSGEREESIQQLIRAARRSANASDGP
ncbi:MAG: LysR family transcriptional regulator [Myxococcota bacterium]